MKEITMGHASGTTFLGELEVGQAFYDEFGRLGIKTDVEVYSGCCTCLYFVDNCWYTDSEREDAIVTTTGSWLKVEP